MRFALNALNGENDNREWALLPGLCCQAAGGDPDVALPIAAAWLLYYAAAKVMDDVEDRDDLDVWWVQIGSKGAISAATGLYFTASLLLSRLDLWLEDQAAAREIRSGMLSRFMEMCSGQHLDLMVEKPNLEEYQRIAAAKSGTFFSMACWAGARLATNQSKILDGFQEYGKQMGLLIQLSDDLMDFKRLKADPAEQKFTNLIRSFPVVCVLEDCKEEEKTALLRRLRLESQDHQSAEEIFQMIDQYGGTRSLLAEQDFHFFLGLEGLEKAQAQQPAKGRLIALLDGLHFSEEIV